MSADEAFQTLKTFFESRQAARSALGAIADDVEIGIVIGETVECALFRKGPQPKVEARAAQSPDVIFYIQPESIYALANNSRDDLGDIGVNTLREILAGNIKIKVHGKLWNILNRGYLDMVRKGGAPVTRFLAQHGLASVPKIVKAIKRLRR